MFNSSSLGPSNQGANSTVNFGVTPGMLQSTPTAPSSNNPATSAVPNMFQSVKKSDTATGGLFGNKLLSSPTPLSQPAPTLTSTNTLTSNTQPNPSFSIFSQNNNNTNPIQQNTQYEGIGVYGVQVNPVAMTVGQQMPPSLVTSTNVKKPKHKKLNLNDMSYRGIKNQHYLQGDKTGLLQRKKDLIHEKKVNMKFGLGSKDLKKLDINNDKIQQIKERLFKKQNKPKETSNEEEKTKNSTKLEELFGDNITKEVEEEDTNGYWCYPDIKKLEDLADHELVQIDNFTIGRKDCGNIRFCEPIDLNHLLKPSLKENLFGRIVNFNEAEKTVEVYPDEFSDIKPSIGEGLNVRAIITLFNIEYDKEKYNLNEFVNVLKSYPENEFMSYDPFSKIWIFKVRHFSKYGLISDEDRFSYNGNRKIFKTKVVKPFNSPKNVDDGRNYPQPGYYEFENKVTDIKKGDENSYSSSALISDSLKKELLDNPNIIKEMVYEPMNVEVEDIKELLNDNIKAKFEYSDDLLDQLKFANGSIYNKIQLKKDLMSINLEKDSYFYQREEDNKINTIVDIDNDIDNDINTESQITKKDQELLKDLKDKSILEAFESDVVVKINKTTLKFSDIKEYSLIFRIFAILFDENKAKKYKILFDFINEYCLNEISKLNVTSDYNNIFKFLAFKDVESAVELALQTGLSHLPSILSLLTSMSLSKDMHDSMKKIAEESIKEHQDMKLLPIYRILANDESLVSDENCIHIEEMDKDTQKIMRLMALMNYMVLDDYETVDVFFKKNILILANQSGFNNPLLKCLKLYAELDNIKKVDVIEEEKVFESFVLYSVLKSNYQQNQLDYDSLIVDFKNELDFNGVLENLFLNLFISNDEIRKESITSVINNNIETVIDNKESLINQLKISSDLVYSLIGDYYAKNGQVILEMNSYLRTTDNEDKIIDLFLNKTGPYLIFLNKYKELSEMINTFGNYKSNESIEILRLFLDYKLSKHTDKRLLRELIEKMELFQTDREEFRNHLYKFVIEQYMLNYHEDEEVLPKRLLQFIENLNVDNESLNNYFRKVILSSINK